MEMLIATPLYRSPSPVDPPRSLVGSSSTNGSTLSDDESESVSRETTPCSESPQLADNETPTPPPPAATTVVPSSAMTTTCNEEQQQEDQQQQPTSNINARVSSPEGSGASTDFGASSLSSSQVVGEETQSLAHQLNLRIKPKVSERGGGGGWEGSFD